MLHALIIGEQKNKDPDLQTSVSLQVSRISVVVSLVMFVSVDYVVRE